MHEIPLVQKAVACHAEAKLEQGMNPFKKYMYSWAAKNLRAVEPAGDHTLTAWLQQCKNIIGDFVGANAKGMMSDSLEQRASPVQNNLKTQAYSIFLLDGVMSMQPCC